MSGRVLKFVSEILCLTFATSLAKADLSRPLISHAGASVTGSLNILSGAGHQFNINVDYAVFAPGQFSAQGGAFNPFGTFSSLSGTDYVYAYQIFSNGPQSGVTDPSTAAMSKIGIDMSNGIIHSMGYDLNLDPASSEVNASAAYAYANSFLFAFNPRLDPDHRSTILLVSSPNRWIMEPVAILNGGLSGSGLLPSPHLNPAPSATLLVLVGLTVLATLRPARAAILAPLR